MAQKDSGYQGTTMGFVTPDDKPSGSLTGQWKDSLTRVVPALTRGIEDIQHRSPRTGSFIAVGIIASAAITAAHPDIAGAAHGDFERARSAAMNGTATCIQADVQCNPAQKLGEFVANFEKQFAQGQQDGLKQAVQKREAARAVKLSQN